MSHFTADHQGFYLKGDPFYPLIQEEGSAMEPWSNAAVVRLPAGLDQDLDWTFAKQVAEQIVAEGKLILWELDLGLDSFVWTPEDLTSFHSFSLALDQFCLGMLPLFKEYTLGVSLYRGKLNFPIQFPFFWWETSFTQWQEESGRKNSDSYTIFCADLLSDYIHRLVSILPAEVIPFAFFDITDYPSFSYIAHLLLQERFEYVTLGLKGLQGPHAGLCWEDGGPAQGYLGKLERKEMKIVPSIGLFLPESSQWDPSLLDQMDKVLGYLNDSKVPFRLIESFKLTEQWDGLDQIIVPSISKISLQDKRKFLGFIAAGGTVVHLANGVIVEWEL